MGRQLCWKDHLVFVCNAVCMYRWIMDGCMYVRSRQHQKVNLRSLMRMQWPISVKLGMWVVGAQVLPTWSVVTKCAYLIPHLHICSDWLITKKSTIQSFVWATLMKLGCDGHKYYPYGLSSLNVHLHICSNWLMTKNQIWNNWYSHVKSNLRLLPTYAHQRRPTLYILWIKRARKPRTAKF